MRGNLTHRVHRIWYAESPIWLLIPLSYIYRFFYSVIKRWQSRNVTKNPLPTIIVGNLTVGGTGKTPFVIYLCQYFKKLGYKPAVISRGYHSCAPKYPYRVETEDDALITGDEPLLIARETQVPVIIGADRRASIQFVVEHLDCDLIISDDGLQHFALRGDCEIIVIDGARKFGNGYCLPAGPLREPLSRLNTVDLVVYHQADNNQQASFYLAPDHFTQLHGTGSKNLAEMATFLKNKATVAMAGIGHPERFYQSLKKCFNDIHFKTIALSDHHMFTPDDFMAYSESIIIMTEKDAVKCRHIHHPSIWVMKTTCIVNENLRAEIEKIMMKK